MPILSAKTRKRVWQGLVAVILIFIAIAVILSSTLAHILSTQITQALRQNGFPQATVVVHDLGWARAQASVQLDQTGQQIIPDLELHYPVSRLFHLQADQLIIKDLHITVEQGTDKTWHIAGYKPTSSSPAGHWPIIPLYKVTLEDAHIVLRTPQQTAEVTLNAALTQGDNAWWSLEGQIKATHSLVEVTNQITGRVQAIPNLNMDLHLESDLNFTEPAFIAPMHLSSQIQGSMDQGWTIKAEGGALQNQIQAKLEGILGPYTQEGKVNFQLLPLTLSPTLPLTQVSPWIAYRIDEMTGTLAADVSLSWEGQQHQGQGHVVLKNLNVRNAGAKLEDINGTISFDPWSPVPLPTSQVLTIKTLSLGVPLTDVTLKFGIPQTGVVKVTSAQAHWASGVLQMNPFSLDWIKKQADVIVQIKDVQLADILALVNVEGLKATGLLSGQIPVRLKGDTITFNHGILQANKPGELRYQPTEPPAFLQKDSGSGAAILLEALSDFQYKTLQATLEGSVGGETTIGLHVAGANPTFYGGYPVSLNLQLSGALGTILQQSMHVYQIPQSLEQHLMQQSH